MALAALASVILVAPTSTAHAASSKGCTDGGFRLVNLTTGATITTAGKDRIRTTLPAAQFGDRFAVRGRYTQFEVRSSDFAVFDQSFTGAANQLDLTGGRFTPVSPARSPTIAG